VRLSLRFVRQLKNGLLPPNQSFLEFRFVEEFKLYRELNVDRLRDARLSLECE
jgi:hypothetical protein